MVKVIGAGLAGCEAAWQLAKRGIKVELFEMKPSKFTPAHSYGGFAELVCSNSLRSNMLNNAVGLLKEELRRLGSLIMECADETKVPAGGALAVDRTLFSDLVTKKIMTNENIKVVNAEITEIPDGDVIIATGPLTSGNLFECIKNLTGSDNLYFYDAAAPIVEYESIDFSSAYKASRYGKGDDDYINCPMTKEEYDIFYHELVNAECTGIKSVDKEIVFEGCMPVETMAKRGEETLLFGPLKPVGLEDPKTGKTPYAVVQLRQDNKAGTLYNIVGFQTHLKWGEQKRVFSLIPALKNAEFARYGVMHRNTFINSPLLLDETYNLKSHKNIYFAGQMTGVEGYIESTASGFTAGINMANKLSGKEHVIFGNKTAIGALANYISNGSAADFQPMNVNFGLVEPLGYKVRKKAEKNLALSERALKIIDETAEVL